jgi:hypothetical protein
MGAQVDSGGIRFGQTHMIWSNGNMKMVQAAQFMDIVVVSPLWVEQCRESAKLVAVDGFIVAPQDAMKAPHSTDEKGGSAVLQIPVAHVADEFEDPDAFSSSQRIMAKSAVVNVKKSGGKSKLGVINRRGSDVAKLTKSAPLPGSSRNNKSSSSGCFHQDGSEEDLAPATSSKRTSTNVASEEGCAAARGGKRPRPLPPSSLSKETESSAITKLAPKGRMLSKFAFDSESDTDESEPELLNPAESSKSRGRGRSSTGTNSKDKVPVENTHSSSKNKNKDSSAELCSTSKRKAPPAKQSIKKSDIRENVIGIKSPKEKKISDAKKTVAIQNKSVAKYQEAPNTTASRTSKTATTTVAKKLIQKDAELVKPIKPKSRIATSNEDASKLVLSVSGFSSEERSLLEDIIESLISLQPQSKSKKHVAGGGELYVSLQQPDPQMELQLIKAFTSCTHVVCPDDAASSK